METPNRKPAGNSILKTLPTDIQRQLFDAMSVGTIQDGLDWLCAEHMELLDADRPAPSVSAGSRWYAWYADTRLLRDSGEAVENFQDYLKEQLPGMPLETLVDTGNNAFLAMQMKEGDPAKWTKVLTAVTRWLKMKNDTRKLAMLEAKLKETEDLVNSGESAQSMKDKLRKIYGRAE